MAGDESKKMVERIIGKAIEPGSKNTLSLGDVRDWLLDYLEMYAEDVVRFPDQKGRSHWDLIMADSDPTRDALFLAAVFSGTSVTFAAGRGNAQSIKNYVESDFPEDPDRFLEELSSRFMIAGDPAVIPRSELDDWI